MPNKQRTFGQYETPPDVADLVLALCLRRATDRVLDPSCGAGAFLQRAQRWQAWLAGEPELPADRLWGVELDRGAARAAQESLPGAHVLNQNFFTLEHWHAFDAVVGNPPYTRAEWIDRLEQEAGEQLAMFATQAGDESEDKAAIIPAQLWKRGLNRRAGLHTYFFLHSARFLRQGGRLGFVVPNNWLDVAYGRALKQFLLDQFKVLALIESTVERWFNEASVNTCLVVLEKCDDVEARRAHLVRFVQLRQKLEELIPYPPDHRAHFSQVESLTTRLLPARDRTTEAIRVRVVPQGNLKAEEKWGILWRAPAFYRQIRRGAPDRRRAADRHLGPVRQWAEVQRGFTTGANAFFYLDEETVNRWQIEPRFRRPLLKSLQQVHDLRVDRTQCDQEVLTISPAANLAGTAAAEYVAWGESQGYHERRTCRARSPWYALPQQESAPLVLPKGIWKRHLAPVLEESIAVDQQLYQVRLHPGVPAPVAAALLNSAWVALLLELHGRGNFGEGVLWLAGYEVQNLLLPDPRYLQPDQVQRLERCFERIAGRALAPDLPGELARSDRQALDEAVFDLLGLSETEAIVVLDTLREQAASRQQRARS